MQITREALAPMIAASRRSLIEILDALDDHTWTKPTLCTEWNVKELVAHVVRVGDYYAHPSKFAADIVRDRGLGAALTNSAKRRAAKATTAQLVDALDDTAYERTRTWRMHPWPAMALGEYVIHTCDITRPLGVPSRATTEQLTVIADLLTRPRRDPFRFPWGAPPVDAVRYEASDADWSHGAGTTIRGPLEAIVMTIAGRNTELRTAGGT